MKKNVIQFIKSNEVKYLKTFRSGKILSNKNLTNNIEEAVKFNYYESAKLIVMEIVKNESVFIEKHDIKAMIKTIEITY